MSLRDKLAERARPYLEPGEHIQAVFRAQSGLSPYWLALINGLIIFIALVTLQDRVKAPLPVTMAVVFAVVFVAVYTVYVVFVRVHHVVVTDRAIMVLDAFMVGVNRPARLRLRHPRNFYFGPMSGLWGKFVLDNTKYRVHMRFHKDVWAADAALAEMTALTEMTQRRQPGPAAAAPVGQQPRSLPPAGWYPDPAGGSAMRYWDGERWGPPAQQARPY